MKELVLQDSKLGKKEDSINITNRPVGKVEVRDLTTGELIYKGKNSVVIAGSAFTAAKHFNLLPDVILPSYNEILGLENSVSEPSKDGLRKEEQVFLFAVGCNGCGKEPKDVLPVKYNGWISPDYLIPFKYVPYNNDLDSADREKYFGRKVIEADKRIAYYFKRFESKPVFKQQYLDGTPIDENVYTSDRKDDIESVVKLHLVITNEDCRDFFNQTVGIEEGRISSVSILTAWAKEINGHTYYQDIRPLTEYHFSSESFIENNKGLDITYLLYY